jgi:ubiquinone biosynthesis protein UbiJ
MSLPQTFIAALETACNRYLALDDEALPKLARFEGKVIAINILGINQKLFLFPSADGMMILGDFDAEADTTLSGTPMALARLGMSDDAASVMFSGEVQISGDVRLGNQFKKVLQQLHIDWEEQLSKVVGDMAAHQIGNAVRDFSRWFARSNQSMHLNTGEYLQEEVRMVVGKAELDRFVKNVDELRDAIERLEARITRLK